MYLPPLLAFFLHYTLPVYIFFPFLLMLWKPNRRKKYSALLSDINCVGRVPNDHDRKWKMTRRVSLFIGVHYGCSCSSALTLMLPSKDDLLAFPTFAPLIAAVIAPLSTLLDIPALTEPWFFQQDSNTGNMNPLPDPHANLALSAIGLAFNVAANGLLIIRFSVSDSMWQYATRASLVCWIAKVRIRYTLTPLFESK